MTDRKTHAISDRGQFALVTDELADTFSFRWFQPGFWAEQARPVTSGGRGAAWFLDSPLGRWVLRRFCRGGLPGRFIKRSYLFLGRSRVRSIREYELLLSLREQGLPVPAPIAAGYWRQGLQYQAALILERIENSKPLMEFQHPDHGSLWQQAGVCIRRFHDQGVYHADLNANNILVRDDGEQSEIYLIDFDRGRYHSDRRATAPWKQANLTRLARSVRKGTQGLSDAERDQLLQSLHRGYCSG